MTLSQDSMMELMAYADGELDGDARVRVEALIASNDEARRVVEAMGGLGDWMREGLDARAELAKADTIADAVMTRIAAEPAAASSNAASPANGGNVVRFEERAAARKTGGRGRFVGGAIGLLALAAAGILFVRSGDSPATRNTPPIAPIANGPGEGPAIGPLPGAAVQAVQGATPAPSGEPGVVAQADDVSGVDVEQVESPSHQVSVFYLPAVAAAAAGSSASSVVVWIGDDKVSGGH